MQVFRRGDRGPAVAAIRAKLERLGLLPVGDAEHDLFDDGTDRAVRAFQQRRGLRVDGVVGTETYRSLDGAHWRLGDRVLSYTAGHPFVGDDVAMLQQRLLDMGFDPGRCDSIFGEQTESALREFQRNVGLQADGTVGPATLKALDMLRRTVTGGSPSEQREEERLRGGGGTLSGRTIVLDPGHGGDDLGSYGHGVAEADVAFDLATRIEGRLGPLGVHALLTRGADSCPDDAARAALANDTGADLFISLHTDAASSERPCGLATYYYGAELPHRVVSSVVGERLAGLVQREIVARTDLLDARTHPKAWQLLRLTRMPAVRLDVGYITNEHDAARLAAPEFRDAVAEAVVAAVQRLYLPDGDDIPTGQFRMPAFSR
ncbi:MAG TPA: N-acetylmuramoyl-L-alanine amidase [Mycobacteriales bacterium]|nr:N-acetylmuramoyl-L-alanine amidase [Mycobacteriales bacterium]